MRRGTHQLTAVTMKRKTTPPPHSPPTIMHPSKYVHTVYIMAESGGGGDEKIGEHRRRGDLSTDCKNIKSYNSLNRCSYCTAYTIVGVEGEEPVEIGE